MSIPEFKILIAEDDRDICEVYEQAVASISGRAQIRIVHDGSQAANLLRSEKFHVAVLDIKLPTVNGLQVGQIARENEANKVTPLIIASGSLNDEAQKRAMSLGKVQCISKPVEIEALKKAIVSVVTTGAHAGFDAKAIELIHRSCLTALKAVPALNAVKTEKASMVDTHSQTLSGMTAVCLAIANTQRATLRMNVDSVTLELMKAQVPPDDSTSSHLAALIENLLLTWNKELTTNANGLGRRMAINFVELVGGNDYVLQSAEPKRTLFLPFMVGAGRVTVQLVLGSSKPKKAESDASTSSGELIMN